MKNYKITFLGTCACDFSDKLNNEFKDCFDKNARRASAVMINDNFLIDSGLHVLDSLRIAKKDLGEISDIFISHLHSDHFNLDNIKKIAKCTKSLRLWVREDAEIPQIENVQIVKMTPYTEYEVKSGVYVTGLLANHDPSSCPQHLIFKCGERKLFYGCDGAWLLTPTYNYLKKAELDVAIFDCTMGDYLGDYRVGEHNCISMLRILLPSLKNERIITNDTRVYFSHLAPSLHKPHDETEIIANGFGASVAYDGLVTEL